MECPECQHKNREGARFCEECGANLQVVCPKCGHELRPEAKFCDECGAKASEFAQDQQPNAIPKLEDAYVRLQQEMPGSIARKIQAAERLEGENRILSILFADIGDSVAIIGRMLPEEGADLVSKCLNAMVDIILKYEGSINRFLGDSVLAFFGVPEAHESDPERAILAGLEMRDAVAELNLNISVGINTGMVYVGPIGPDSHSEFTAMGKAANLAARLEGAAQPGQVMVGERTYRFTKRSFKFKPIHNLSLKGISEPVTGYIALKSLPKLEKVRGIEGLQARLVGRDEELRILKDILRDAIQGRGQMVSIIGEAGVGKSRLVAELRNSIQNDTSLLSTPLWLEGRCLSLGIAASYWPFIDMLREYFRDGTQNSDSMVASDIVARLRELVENGHLTEDRFQEIGPLLGHLLSAKSCSDWDNSMQSLEPRQLKNQMFIAIRDFFLALSKQESLILVFDDLHWADGLSLDLIYVLMEILTLAPILLVCIYRPEQDHKSWHLAAVAGQKIPERYTEIRLRELTPEQSQHLVQSLLKIQNLPISIRDIILEKSQGNPFFVEEVIRSLIAAGAIYQRGKLWYASEDIDSIAVPESIQSVILSRLDRLEQELKHVLQSASVIGRLFRRQLLDHVTEQTIELERDLWELEDEELIYLERVIPEEEYSFKHAFTQETVYQSILKRRKNLIHEKVAESMESLYQGGLEEYYERLAYHYDQSNNREKAIEYLLKAGEKSQRAYLNEAAIEFFKRALKILDGTEFPDPRMEWKSEIATRLYEYLGDLLKLIGEYKKARDAYESALAQITTQHGIWRARLHRKNGINYSSELQYEEALKESINAENILKKKQDEDSYEWHQEWLEIMLYRMLTIHYWLFQWHEMQELAEEIRPVLAQYGTPAQLSRFFKGLVATHCSKYMYSISQETLEYAQEALKASQESGNAIEIASAQFLLGFSHLLLRNLEAAEALLQTSMKTAERTEDKSLQTRCVNYMAITKRWQDNVEETQKYALLTLNIANELGVPEYIGMARGNLAWVKWREGNIDEAENYGKAGLEALQEIRKLKHPVPFEWTVLWPMIGIMNAKKQLSQAVEYIYGLLDPTQQAQPDEIKLLLEETLKSWDRNKWEEAQECLDRAIKKAQEVGYL